MCTIESLKLGIVGNRDKCHVPSPGVVLPFLFCVGLNTALGQSMENVQACGTGLVDAKEDYNEPGGRYLLPASHTIADSDFDPFYGS
mmetsp:Transcript_25381/g.37382  ORF Transcript_25381/g.37382 Transcript_25381/m.37382 type:complete len:87 (-) Transcript_25381:732-992(-)